MYYITKRLEVSAAHQLELDYVSKCTRLHGHNWIITVYCKTEKLDDNGMVIDFTLVKKAIHGALDHRVINDVITVNPTAENIAKWIVDQIPQCYRADVQESEGNTATYIDE